MTQKKCFGAFGVPKDLAQLERLRLIDPAKIIVVDTETTGLDPEKDEVLSVSIVDAAGNVLFDSLVKPARRKRWPDAQKVHGISWKDVKDMEELLDLGDEIDAVFRSALLVVGYNVEFDIDMLKGGGLRLSNAPLFDVMREFAPVNGSWNSYRNDWRWSKLTACAKHYKVPDFKAHGSLADARATAACFNALIHDAEYERILIDMDISAMESQLKAARYKKALKEANRKEQLNRAKAFIFWIKFVSCAISILISLIVILIPLSLRFSSLGTILGIALTTAITISVYLAVDVSIRWLISSGNPVNRVTMDISVPPCPTNNTSGRG